MVLLLYYFFFVFFRRFLLSKPSDLILGMRNDEKPPPEAKISPSYEFNSLIHTRTPKSRGFSRFPPSATTSSHPLAQGRQKMGHPGHYLKPE